MVKITRLLFGMPGPWPWLGLTGLIFGWYQVDTSLRGGQPATVILFLLVTVWALLREDRDVLAGMVLAVAAFLHAFPVLLGLWFLFRRRRAAISMTASLAVLAVAIGALTTPMVFAEWQKTISRISEVFVPILGNVSLAGLATSFLKGMEWNPHTREVSYLALGLILGLLAWFLFRNPQRASRQLMDLELAIFIGALLLASPISWPRYFPILLFPIAVYLKYAPTSQAVPQKATGLLWLLLCFALPGSGLGTVESWAQSHIGFPAAWLLAALPTVAVVTLVLWLYRTYSRMRAQAVQ
jgi:lipoprotein signal peptidase